MAMHYTKLAFAGIVLSPIIVPLVVASAACYRAYRSLVRSEESLPDRTVGQSDLSHRLEDHILEQGRRTTIDQKTGNAKY